MLGSGERRGFGLGFEGRKERRRVLGWRGMILTFSIFSLMVFEVWRMVVFVDGRRESGNVQKNVGK